MPLDSPPLPARFRTPEYLATLRRRIVLRVTVDARTGCWNWTGKTHQRTAARYPMMKIGSRNVGAHRVSLMLRTGQWYRWKDACHRCDHPLCVNPEHLFWGTHRVNMLAWAKRRWGVVDDQAKTAGHVLGENGEDEADGRERVSGVGVCEGRDAED